jgi:DNA mismatch endonuclease, patch repair protein
MKGNRGSNTRPQLALRSELHQRGLRYRIGYPITVDGRRMRPDIVFTRARIAVFVDGCFWHRCPEHGTTPKSNNWYWTPKLDANTARDRGDDEALTDAGWMPLRCWEHEPVTDAAARVVDAIRAARIAAARLTLGAAYKGDLRSTATPIPKTQID